LDSRHDRQDSGRLMFAFVKACEKV
jgi:hypothetical protein